MHLSQSLGARVDGPKHLLKYFDIWDNTKKLENIKNVSGKCVDQVYFVEKRSKREELKFWIS